MKSYFLTLFILCGFNLNAEIPHLPAGSVLEADFTQHRHLNGIPKPIKSEGHLVLWDNKGIVWSTITPFPNTILITKIGLYQLQNKVKTAIVKAGGDSAMFDVMAGIFNIKDEKQINGFSIQELPPGNSLWRIRLLTKHRQMQHLISSITLEGDSQIRHITIYRPNGDHDEIYMRNHQINESATPMLQEIFNE